MGNFIQDIPSIEFFLILVMLILGTVALQAFSYRRNLAQEDTHLLFQWIFKGLIGLTLLAALLIVIALVAK